MDPPTPTREVQPDLVQKFGVVIDTLYTNTEGFCYCEYNEKAKEKLAHCLTDTRKRQQDHQVGLATLRLMVFALLTLQETSRENEPLLPDHLLAGFG